MHASAQHHPFFCPESHNVIGAATIVMAVPRITLYVQYNWEVPDAG